LVEELQLYNNFVKDFNNKLYEITSNNYFSDIIFLCVGTDRVTGDCFGPLVGYKLKGLFNDIYNVKIIGDLNAPISSSNIRSRTLDIYKDYEKPCIIAIDAALSKQEDVGKIIVTAGGMHLGKCLNKSIAFIGDISIKGVVAKNLKVANSNLRVLKATPLSLVMDLADVTAKGIYEVVKYM